MISVAIATMETLKASMTMNSASGSGFVGWNMPPKDAKTGVLAMSNILRRTRELRALPFKGRTG
jgi:hypothetical protein